MLHPYKKTKKKRVRARPKNYTKNLNDACDMFVIFQMSEDENEDERSKWMEH